MSNVIKGPAEWQSPQKAPEVFFVLDALMRPEPAHEPNLPELKDKIKPFMSSIVKLELISPAPTPALQK